MENISKESVELKFKEENNFEKIFNSAPVGFIVVDENELITKVNDAALEFLDSEKENSIGKRFGDAFFCENSFLNEQGCGYSTKCKSCQIKMGVSAALQSEISTTNIEFNRVFSVNQKEREFWFKASITPMFEEHKKNAVITFINITARKNKEILIQKSRDFYLRMLESFPALVWRTDLEGNSFYLNRNWSEFTGRPKEEGLVLGWVNFIHPEDRDKYSMLRTKAIKEKQSFNIQYRMLHKSGKYRWIQDIGSPFYEVDGSFDGYISIALDITDRKLGEEGLRRYKILSEKVRDIMLFVEKDGRIIDANKAAIKEYGYSREELLKLTIFNLRENRDLAIEQMEEADKKGVFFETKHKRKDGSWFPVEVSSKGTTINGRRVLLSIIRDICERKKSEYVLRQAKEQAEIANKAKSEFLANMSHEIRTPLNGIVGMVELMRLTDLNKEQEENLMIVKSCAKSLLTVINDILDFSKMEAGKLVIENINFDIKSLIENTIKAHSPSALKKGIQLNYAFSSTIPQDLVGDPNRLQQILNNLISNAIKFTESGEVWVKVTNAYIDDNKVEVQFVVEDSGIGIEEENLVRIFESFSQVDGSFTRRFGGTGLGLAISKQLSEIMGGRLWVESEKGKGSAFYFTLNFQVGTKREEKPVQTQQLNKNDLICNINILLTEDDKVNQMVTTRILKECGYCVDIANNGLEAVEMCEKNSYDAILMDIQMPGMDGIQATKKIRENNKRTPIIALTAYALKGDRERFLSQGMDEYVSKPIKIENLVNVIEKCISLDKREEDLSDISICFDESGEIVLKSKEYQWFNKKELSMLDELSEIIDSLNNAVNKGEFASIEILAHKIKSLSYEIGIEELKTISFKIELAVRRGDFSEAVEKAKKVSCMFETFKKSIS